MSRRDQQQPPAAGNSGAGGRRVTVVARADGTHTTDSPDHTVETNRNGYAVIPRPRDGERS